MLGKPVVVIDSNPDAEVVEQSRVRQIELLTGDATRDGTLDLCNLPAARALIALTSTDTANLEVALGARGRAPHLPVVMRVQDDSFAGFRRSSIRGIADIFNLVARRAGLRGPLALPRNALAHRIWGRGLQRW